LSDDALAELERLLDHPERDPHGRSIPSPSAPSDKGGVS
jgi:Mn-dependent DtxR family transcriptional regulator